jgi:hypothetical protein
MPRLPQPGSDTGKWGEILNEFLSASHANDGQLKTSIVGAPQLKPASVTSAALSDGHVTTSKLADGAVTKDKLATSQPNNGQVLSYDAGNLVWTTPAQAAVTSVASKTGAVTLAKDDVGLGNVDNTSDANKPVSSATQTALNTKLDASQKAASNGVASLDSNSKLPESQLPDRLSTGQLSATYLGLVQAAKNPDVLVTGAITLDGSDQVSTAAVAWPDGTPGILTITARHATGAVTAYTITYGSPVTKTFTQPTITRNTNGAATNIPQIEVS